MTAPPVDRLRELLEKATAQGNWLWHDNGVVTARDKIVLCLDMGWARIPDGEDFEYLRAGMQALPALLEQAARVESLIEALSTVCEHFDGKRRDKDWFETERLVRAALQERSE